MSFLIHWSGASDFVPAAAALARYKNSPAIYRPFFALLWIVAINSIISIVCVQFFRNNILNSNIYVLVESILLLNLFYRWNGSKRKNKYILLAVLGVLIWAFDNIVLHNPVKTINSIFKEYYSVVIIFLSIDLINRLIVFEQKRLLKNPMFLICATFVCMFSYKAYIESFYLIKFSFTNDFLTNVFQIYRFVNLFSNLVFTIAILCIPKKQESFMLR